MSRHYQATVAGPTSAYSVTVPRAVAATLRRPKASPLEVLDRQAATRCLHRLHDGRQRPSPRRGDQPLLEVARRCAPTPVRRCSRTSRQICAAGATPMTVTIRVSVETDSHPGQILTWPTSQPQPRLSTSGRDSTRSWPATAARLPAPLPPASTRTHHDEVANTIRLAGADARRPGIPPPKHDAGRTPPAPETANNLPPLHHERANPGEPLLQPSGSPIRRNTNATRACEPITATPSSPGIGPDRDYGRSPVRDERRHRNATPDNSR